MFKRTGLSALAAVAALALLGLAAPVQAQQGAVAGQVVDASTMQPIQGAQVTIQGTQLGALSGQDGRYRITGVPAGEQTVRVRLLGYRTASRAVTVEAGATATADFQLQVSAVELEQVVVTATGERRVREVGHAVSTVDAADAVEKSAPQNLTNLLKGRSTGVTVQRSSGSVGTGDLIKIRGNSSIGLSNVPIIIVDGARIDNDNDTGPGVGGQDASLLNDLNPEDIESVEILKGPAAAALYGTAAATGVIRITTKQGTASGATRYTLRGDIGVNRKSLVEWPSQFFRGNAFGFGKDTLYEMNLLLEDVAPTPELRDIYRSPFRDGVIQAYGGTVRGGSEDVTYFLSGEFQPEEGNLPNNEFDKYTARANFNLTPSDKLDISVSSGFHSNFLNLPDNDNNGFGYIGIALVGFPWETPITMSDPATGESVQSCPLQFELARAFGLPVSVIEAIGVGCSDNPFFGDRTPNDVATLVNEQHTERFTGSASGTYRPFDFLTARATLGYDEVSNDVPQLVPVDPGRPFGTFSEGFKTSFQNESRNITLNGSATANFDLTEDLNSQTTAGVQWFREVEEATFGTGQTLPSGCTVISCAVTTTGGETFVEEINAGFFFQEQLGYKDRLFLTGSVRFDDNSAFGEELGLQTLPSVTISYLPSDEEWFPEFFESFRVRGAWGKAGVQPGPFDALQLLNPTRVTFQNASTSGVTVTDPGNPNLKTETGEEFELGIDMSMLDGRLSLESTYYDQTTSDAIVFQPLKPSFGFPGQQPTNVGEITSSGFEFGLDAVALEAEDLNWSWRVNLSTNDGEITELTEPIIFGLGGSSQRHKEGFPFASYFTEPISVEGGDVVVDSTQFIGHPTPEWEGSVSTTVSMFERITLFGQLDFAGGHQQFNSTAEFRCGFLGGGAFGSVCGDSFERGPDGEFTDEARIKQRASAILSEAPWIEDADYAKLRSVSVRFDVPESWLSAFSASRASVTLIGENLATFTGYDGLDPEINFGGSGSEATRADFLTLPPAQRYLAQVSLTF